MLNYSSVVIGVQCHGRRGRNAMAIAPRRLLRVRLRRPLATVTPKRTTTFCGSSLLLKKKVVMGTQ